MGMTSLYRTLAAAAVAAALMATGCADASKSHQTMKQEQYSRWNLTRVAIMQQLAEQQYEVGDYDKCKKTLAEALALNVPCGPLQELAGKVEIEKGSLSAAADYFKEAARLQPTKAEPLYLLGVVYQRWQKAEVAEDYYHQAWDRKPGEVLYMLAVAEMQITLGKLDDAQKMLEGKLVYFEQSAAVRIALARIAGLKNDHAMASRYYRDATILMPDDQGVRRSYAEELYFAGKYNDAASIFEDMRKQDKTADHDSLVLMLGEAYLKMNRPFDARNCFQELTRTNPNSVQAFLALAKACIQTNDLGIAIAASRKVMREEPGNTQAFLLLAVAQQKQKKWSDAQATLEKAATLSPTDSTVLCMLGLSEQRLGRHEEAMTCYQKAMAVNPKDEWASELLDKARAKSEDPAVEVPPSMGATGESHEGEVPDATASH